MENDQTPLGPEPESEQNADPFARAKERADAAKTARLAAAMPKPDDDDDCREGAIGDYRQSAPDAPEQPEAERWPLRQDQTSFGYGMLEQPTNFSQPDQQLSPLDKARERRLDAFAKAQERANLAKGERLATQPARSRDFGMER